MLLLAACAFSLCDFNTGKRPCRSRTGDEGTDCDKVGMITCSSCIECPCGCWSFWVEYTLARNSGTRTSSNEWQTGSSSPFPVMPNRITWPFPLEVEWWTFFLADIFLTRSNILFFFFTGGCRLRSSRSSTVANTLPSWEYLRGLTTSSWSPETLSHSMLTGLCGSVTDLKVSITSNI